MRSLVTTIKTDITRKSAEKCYNQCLWNLKRSQKIAEKIPKRKTKRRNSSEGEEVEFSVGRFPLSVADDPIPENECTTPPSANFDTPDRANVLLTPLLRVKTTLATVR